MTPLKIITILFLLITGVSTKAQYILNGAAQKDNCHCYTLTPEDFTKSGSVWNNTKIDLHNSFDFWFNVFLGCKDGNGADGIVFMLQPLSTNVGTTGEGMGFDGIRPSIGIALDTWQNSNLNDPAFDHISIQSNGNIMHGADLAGPVPISDTSANVEDCKWHKLRISWDASSFWLRTYFDDVIRVEKKVNLLDSIFTSSPLVYWGFSAATGGASNLQQFCTALTAKFTTNLNADTVCIGQGLQFQNETESFAPPAGYSWDFGDGTTSSQKDPPPHIYNQPGNYTIKFSVKALDGCTSDTVKKKIFVAPYPAASFSLADICANDTLAVIFNKENYAVSYNWQLNGNSFSQAKDPPVNTLSPGDYHLSLTLTSTAGCGSPSTASDSFHIYPRPYISATIGNGCVKDSIYFNAVQTDTLAVINDWKWKFSSGAEILQPAGKISFKKPGSYYAQTWASSVKGCLSDTVDNSFVIEKAIIHAGADTTIMPNKPAQLQAVGNGKFLWDPSYGLSSDTVANPVVLLNADQGYKITVTTAEGCVAADSIYISIFKGAFIYAPNAFTPNGDGLNDVFHIHYKGIKDLQGFSIYNRWGQRLFYTTDKTAGWDGKWQGKAQPPGSYVWILEATDLPGKKHQLKGVVTIIR
jgi:gliding motility-associated-like protein